MRCVNEGNAYDKHYTCIMFTYVNGCKQMAKSPFVCIELRNCLFVLNCNTQELIDGMSLFVHMELWYRKQLIQMGLFVRMELELSHMGLFVCLEIE